MMNVPTEELGSLLRELAAELQVRNNPERRAFGTLKPNSRGWTTEIYSDEAFQTWEGIFRQVPNDYQTTHHLAIMYHARAFDREQSGDTARASADWERALTLWHRLWQDDAFWAQLGNRTEHERANPFLTVRSSWPAQLLQVHFDIAFDERTKHYRARQQIQLALSSPFPQEAKDSVRLATYRAVTAHLHPVVWAGTTFDQATLEPAIRAIKAYLDLDEEFWPALTDLLGLVVKLQTGCVLNTNAADGDAATKRQLEDAAALATAYDPYVRRLEAHLAELPPETIGDLVMWHSRHGQALRMLGSYEVAAEHYQRANTAARQGTSDLAPQRETRRGWVFCVLLAARERAKGNEAEEARAREILKPIMGEAELPAACLWLRANTYFLLKELAAAERDCLDALAAADREETEDLDYEPIEATARVRSECEALLGHIQRARRDQEVSEVLERATGELDADNPGTALELVEGAIRIAPESVPALLLRARCLLRRVELGQALADLERAHELAVADGDLVTIAAIHHLRRDAEALGAPGGEAGGGSVHGLRQEAVERIDAGRFGAR